MVRTVIIVVAESWWCCSYCGSSKTPGRDSAGLRPLYWPRPRFLNAPWRGLCFVPSPRCAGPRVVRP